MNEYEKSLNRIERNTFPNDWNEIDVAHYITIKRALEKQIPKKPIYEEKFYSCPECGDEMTILNGDKFCTQCGQALDWSDEE